ncbi:MAG TPA: ribonuclease Z [Salinimicrobium sp.]|nr:ribonuclease Z [Salinimicrobium sp.]
MKILDKDFYKIIKPKEVGVKEFLQELESKNENFRQENLVIDLLKFKELSVNDLLLFLPLSNQHRSNKRSFVIVNDALNIDEVPEEMLVVPTLLEAEDIIQMEEIERDLGF